MKPTASKPAVPITVPTHWSPEQALAALECLHAMREAIWSSYGSDVQQAWREQLEPDRQPPPEFDPDMPF